MIVNRLRHWLAVRFVRLGFVCLHVAEQIEPPNTPPPPRPPLNLTPPDDGAGDGPQQQEFRWA